MKKCTKCLLIKNDFKVDNRRKDGLQSHCRECQNNQTSERRKTKVGFVSTTYSNQRGASRHRGMPYPTYSKLELRNWLFSQPKFHELFLEWEQSNYSKDKIPSVDRLNDDIGYSIDNIQLLTWEGNRKKAHMCARVGKIKNQIMPKAIYKLSLDGIVLEEFVSAKDAGRKTGLSSGNIANCCRGYGYVKTIGGFKWRFK